MSAVPKPGNELVRYDAACRALAACKSVDEVKDWHDKAAALQAYGRMAKDKTLEIDAAEIRIRAERRLGEMLAAQKAAGGLNQGVRLAGNKDGEGQGSPALVTDEGRPKLGDAGISYDLSSRAQKLAAVPEAEFEAEVGEWRGRVEAEGARVSARLEKAGERAIKQTEADRLKARIVELETALSEAQEAAAEAGALAQDLLAQIDGEADKRLEQMRAEVHAAKTTRDIALRENAALKRTVKALQRRLGE